MVVVIVVVIMVIVIVVVIVVFMFVVCIDFVIEIVLCCGCMVGVGVFDFGQIFQLYGFLVYVYVVEQVLGIDVGVVVVGEDQFDGVVFDWLQIDNCDVFFVGLQCFLFGIMVVYFGGW